MVESYHWSEKTRREGRVRESVSKCSVRHPGHVLRANEDVVDAGPLQVVARHSAPGAAVELQMPVLHQPNPTLPAAVGIAEQLGDVLHAHMPEEGTGLDFLVGIVQRLQPVAVYLGMFVRAAGDENVAHVSSE